MIDTEVRKLWVADRAEFWRQYQDWKNAAAMGVVAACEAMRSVDDRVMTLRFEHAVSDAARAVAPPGTQGMPATVASIFAAIRTDMRIAYTLAFAQLLWSRIPRGRSVSSVVTPSATVTPQFFLATQVVMPTIVALEMCLDLGAQFDDTVQNALLTWKRMYRNHALELLALVLDDGQQTIQTYDKGAAMILFIQLFEEMRREPAGFDAKTSPKLWDLYADLTKRLRPERPLADAVVRRLVHGIKTISIPSGALLNILGTPEETDSE